MRNVKVFVSSPSDLRRERDAVSTLIRTLNERPTIRDRYKFSPYLYEEHAPAVSGEAPQQVINEQMIEPHGADILICMLWSRMGTPLTEVNPDTGKPYLSGTEWEFYNAYRAYQRTKRPVILLYRCTRKPHDDADTAQIALVDEFFHRFEGADAPLKGLYRTFSTDEQLVRALNNDIDAQIARWERPSQRLIDQLIRPLWFVFVLLAVLIVAAAVLISNRSNVPPLENAPFNVAIAGFVAAPDANVADADVEVLSQALYTNFTQRLDEVRSELPLVIGVWSPVQVGTVSGTTSQERAQNAEALVEHLRSQFNARADILVYGIIEANGNRLSITPEFYVSNNFPEVSEVFGRFGLAAAVYTRNIDQSRALSGDLSNRSQVLAFITQGLVQMIGRQYDDAVRAYDAALAINQDVVGRDVMYVLRGNAAVGNYNLIVGEGNVVEARRLPQLIQQAKSDFQSAVDENPDYARGYAGLGVAEYLDALEGSRAGRMLSVGLDMLDSIEQTFDTALKAKDNPPSADITSKVSFGLGQVEVIRMLEGDNSVVEAARQHFADVLTAYGEGENPRIKELAAEAHARLALIARYQGDYSQAREEFQKAIDLTDLDERATMYQRELLEVSIEEARAKRDFDTASSDYDQLLAMAMLPDERAYAIFQYGKMLGEAGRADAALAAVEQAKNIDFTDFPTLGASIWVELGNLYYDVGRLADSIAAYQQAMTLDPQGQAHLQRVIDDTQAELSAQATLSPTPGG